MERYRGFLLLMLFLFIGLNATGQAKFYSYLRQDTLAVGNKWIERKFIWNKGNLITYSVTDKSTNQVWFNRLQAPDFQMAKEVIAEGNYAAKEIAETDVSAGYLSVEVQVVSGTLSIKKVYRVYEHSPVIACDIYLKGRTDLLADAKSVDAADRKNIEFTQDMKSQQMTEVIDQIKLDGFHWQTKIVEFFDVTDWNNNLVAEKTIIPYRKAPHRGNLLLAHNMENNRGFFLLKEAPVSGVQLAYPGYDFTTDFGHFTLNGLGLTAKDIKAGEWTKAYGSVFGVYSGGELEQLSALRSYQKAIRKLLPGRDEMVMMNTWGDRSQDAKITEQFTLLELERAAKLGISHFQIDDGWQAGRSPNSALAKGSFHNIWDNPDYWKADPVKYPNGLAPIVKKGKALGIEICLWFNPSVQDNYAAWEKDASALVDLYTLYGIRTFKIDGLALPNKQSEINLDKLFKRVLQRTSNRVVFNLDATAGRRAGYFTFNEYGNIFLENRYTDWQNYYPYWTLRNLWQLSKYVPAEKLQIEFLNKWRNAEKYGRDIFAPVNYSFEYLFAITMPGQPLAWLEATGLPEEALKVKDLIRAYRSIQHDFHAGTILPIGDEPSGRSWTGFQSLKGEKGYFIFYRENNPDSNCLIKTWLPEGTKIECVPLLGNGKLLSTLVGKNGTIEVFLPDINDFVMYRYTIKQ